MSNRTLMVILGPTASGKSEYAAGLAKRIGGEIISADSRQVYTHLNIGSGKVPGRWRMADGRRQFIYKGIAHHCIDFVSPRKKFTVAEFKQCAERAITTIYRSGKIPILVGGTGVYIRAVVDGVAFPPVPPNEKLRRTLEKKSTEELFAMLKKKDSHRVKTIEQKNKRRLIRALEIVASLGRVPKPRAVTKYDAKLIGIRRAPEELKKRVEKRISEMVKRGLVRETRKLKALGLSWKRIYELGFEYRLPALYVQKKISKEELREQLIRESLRYARRQMLWWKRDRRIQWISP